MTLTNTPLVRTEQMSGRAGWVWDTFATSVLMPTYLLALTITDYSSVKGRDNVTVWADSKEVAEVEGTFALELAPRVLEYFTNTFGIEYSLPKLDMMAVPSKGGAAMENWGLVLFDQQSLLIDLDADESEVGNILEHKYHVMEVVAHELAHQWFGNLVTLKWWSDTWLQEGLACYCSMIAQDALEPDSRAMERGLVERTLQVMRVDTGGRHRSMASPITSRSDIHSVFGPIAYSKGYALMMMLESILGRSTLLRGLSLYLARHAYSNAQGSDLFTALEEAAREEGRWPQGDLDSLLVTMQRWTHQAGLPLITATLNNGSLTISQEPFLPPRLCDLSCTQVGFSTGHVSVNDFSVNCQQGLCSHQDQSVDLCEVMKSPCGSNSTVEEVVWDVPITWMKVEEEENMAANWTEKEEQWMEELIPTWLSNKSMQVEVPPGTLPLLNKLGVGYYR